MHFKNIAINAASLATVDFTRLALKQLVVGTISRAERCACSLPEVQSAIDRVALFVDTLVLAGRAWQLHWDAGRLSRLPLKVIEYDKNNCDLTVMQHQVDATIADRSDSESRHAINEIQELVHRLVVPSTWYDHQSLSVERICLPYMPVSVIARVITLIAIRLPTLRYLYVPLKSPDAWSAAQRHTPRQLWCIRRSRGRHRVPTKLTVVVGDCAPIVILPLRPPTGRHIKYTKSMIHVGV